MSFIGKIVDYIIGGIIGAIIGAGLQYIWTRKKYIKLWSQLTVGKARGKDVRVSLAYLFRIKIDGRYLLVKNSKIANQYQPIGGIYKRFASFSDVANKLEVTDEKKESFRVTGDLRVYVKSKNTIEFIKWFQTKRNREVNVIREFFEEIIDRQILDANSLKDIKFEFIKTYDSGLHYASQFSSFEILLHDIFEVQLDQRSEDKLKQYVSSSPDKYLILAEQNDIQSKAITIDGVDHKIGEQTINIL